MPFPNFHAARIIDPDKFESFATKKLTDGITAIIGIDKEGKSEIQSVRADQSKFTPSEFKDWLEKHDFKPIDFEEASMKKATNIFAAWMDIDLAKSTDQVQSTEPKTVKIGGIISSDSPDMQGDIIDQDGLDFSYFMKRGYINYEHQQGMNNIVGRPISVNKVNIGNGVATKIEAELYMNLPLSQLVYKTMKDLKEAGDTRKLGFSIEGQVLARDKINPKIIRKSRVLNVSVCALPQNADATLELLARSMNMNTAIMDAAKPDLILDSYNKKDDTILDAATPSVKDSISDTFKEVMREEMSKVMQGEIDKMFDNHSADEKKPVMISISTLSSIVGKVFPQLNKQKQNELARKLLVAASDN